MKLSVPCKALLATLSFYSTHLYIYVSLLINATVSHNQIAMTTLIETRRKRKRKRKSNSAKEMKMENEESWNHGHQTLPLLQDITLLRTEEKTMVQRAISQTFQSTAHLANLLPTGSVLAFQLLSPIFTNQGECDSVSRSMTSGLIALCGLSCFFLCFTDSVKDKNGNVCYGFATLRGLWIIDGSLLTTLPLEIAANYRLRFIDFMHAFMSILVFAAIALFDQNVVSCLYPSPSDETKELLTSLPVGIGVICSMLFVVFPTKRHGIGFPLTC